MIQSSTAVTFVHTTNTEKMISRAVYSVILLLYVVKGEEPHCSKFDFEEKVLEKLVRMEFEMERIKLEMQKSIEVHRKPTVAFKARSNADINVQDGKTLTFPVIIMNVGSGYDSASGIFTAPLNGTYLFTTAFCVKSQKSFFFAIMVDGKQQSATHLYGDANYSCHSADNNAVLTAGQKVWVQVQSSSNTGDIISHTDGHRWNTFSGTLVNG